MYGQELSGRSLNMISGFVMCSADDDRNGLTESCYLYMPYAEGEGDNHHAAGQSGDHAAGWPASEGRANNRTGPALLAYSVLQPD